MRTVPLPLEVDTGATALAIGQALWLWVNRPQDGVTIQLRIGPSSDVEELPPLPIMVSGVAACRGKLLVSGADPRGRATVLGVDLQGETLWAAQFDRAIPTFWPVPGCSPGPTVAFQVGTLEAEVAEVGPNGFTPLRRFATGGPPFDLAITARSVWGLWSDASGVWAAESTPEGPLLRNVASTVASEVAAANVGGEAWLAWARGSPAFLVHESGLNDPIELDLGPAAGGKLAVVPDERPFVWAQRSLPAKRGSLTWVSALSFPDGMPITVKGLVHAVAGWGNRAAVVGSDAVQLFLRQAPGKSARPGRRP